MRNGRVAGTEAGLALPSQSPVNAVNRYPAAAVASIVAAAPASIHPPPRTVPPAAGLATAVTRYCVRKTAV